jgi:hypothetical protein
MSNPNLTLIDGEFTPGEAKEILKNAFWSKIQFHEMKNFSMVERTGSEDIKAVKRIGELKSNLEKLLQIVDEADTKNETLIIQAEICVLSSKPSQIIKELVSS